LRSRVAGAFSRFNIDAGSFSKIYWPFFQVHGALFNKHHFLYSYEAAADLAIAATVRK
jgi:hypothetical protein